jgi:protein-S-isoprenylcysteine O-methyltransferase Ste14
MLGAIAVSAALGPAVGGLLRLAGIAAGGAALFVSAAIALRCARDLRDALTPFPRPRRGADLVESGPYGVVRHPIYAALALGAFGWALVWASPITLVLAIVLFGFFDLKSRREEVWLAAAYPAYDAYRGRTRRLIPFVY